MLAQGCFIGPMVPTSDPVLFIDGRLPVAVRLTSGVIGDYRQGSDREPVATTNCKGVQTKRKVKPPLMIRHSPGHMFITDRLNAEYEV